MVESKKTGGIKRRVSFSKERFLSANEYIKTNILADKFSTKEVNIIEQYERSKTTLGDYVTLDWEHKQDISKLLKTIIYYATDHTKNRPLNIIMLAEPGSGKSHFIKCLAKEMDYENISAITFNMANLQNIDDFIQPLEAIRNLKVLDRLPILFLDEFDSQPTNYALLLPLLWDGELHVGHRDLKLGKVIIIMAGSGFNISLVSKAAKGMQRTLTLDNPKLADLLSRINGGEFNIPCLDIDETGRSRKVDKVCISISLLQQRFGNKLNSIPWAFLRFIAMSNFRYGVRSIAHLIDLIPMIQEDTLEISLKDLKLPLNNVSELKKSSLAYHIIADDGPAAIIQNWREIIETDVLVRFQSPPDEDDLPF